MPYSWAPSTVSFYANELRSDYERAGTWPGDAVGVTDATYNTYSQPPPAGQQRGYDSTTGQPAWVAAPPPTIEQRITALSVLRFEHEVAGVYYRPASQSTAVLFPTDRDTQNKLTAANYLAALGQLPSVNWKTNVTWALLVSAEVQTLFNIVVTYVTRCYEYENHLADLIHAGAVVDITIGWPSQGP
jgi:hypothetical protein